MITPDDRVPQDDTFDEDKDDQMSQQDIHSNGFDEYDKPLDDGNEDESDVLRQAYKATDSSYTLDEDGDDVNNGEDD